VPAKPMKPGNGSLNSELVAHLQTLNAQMAMRSANIYFDRVRCWFSEKTSA
jgi:hypothetical protein